MAQHFDPNAINPFMRTVAPASAAQTERGQRERIASAAHGVNPTARQHARKLVDALSTIAETRAAHGVIRGTAGSGGDGRANAQRMLDTQRAIISQAQSDAKAAMADLKPALLAAVISAPDGSTEAQIADKKQDVVTALSAAGTSGANYRAQQLLAQAMQANDGVMLFVLMGAPMQYQAAALGYSQATLQQKYAAAMLDKYGPRPLLASQSIPGAAMIALLPSIAESISGHVAGATADLNQLAADCALR